MTGIDAQSEAARMAAFHALDYQQQVEAIARLAMTGMTAHDVSHATGLSVEMIRRILGEQRRASHG
jgi:hypothetical protein